MRGTRAGVLLRALTLRQRLSRQPLPSWPGAARHSAALEGPLSLLSASKIRRWGGEQREDWADRERSSSHTPRARGGRQGNREEGNREEGAAERAERTAPRPRYSPASEPHAEPAAAAFPRPARGAGPSGAGRRPLAEGVAAAANGGGGDRAWRRRAAGGGGRALRGSARPAAARPRRVRGEAWERHGGDGRGARRGARAGRPPAARPPAARRPPPARRPPARRRHEAGAPRVQLVGQRGAGRGRGGGEGERGRERVRAGAGRREGGGGGRPG